MADNRYIIGLAGMLLVVAAFGYVISATYVSYKFFGWNNDPDLFFFLKNFQTVQASSPSIFKTALMIFAVPAVLLVVGAPFIFMERLTKFGETHWQTKSELRRNSFLEKSGRSFILGKLGSPGSNAKLLSSARFPHVMVVGSSGRGKGAGFVIPNLLSFEGSTVTLDVSGENFDKTSRHRVRKGDKVYRFAPTDFKHPTHRFNPLQRIYQLKNPDQQQLELSKLANLFLQTESNSAQSFLEGGYSLFTAAGILAFERGNPTIGEIYRILTNGGDQKAYLAYKNEVQSPAAKLIFNRMATEHMEAVSSYVSVLMSSGLRHWENPAVDRATSTSDFDFRNFRSEPSSAYLCISPEDILSQKALVRMFFSDLLSALHASLPTEKEPWPVMIMLDEFDQLGKMPNVPEAIKTLRKHGGHLALITQSIPALDEIYGDKVRKSLQANSGLKLYLTPSEEDTVEELSSSIGKTTKRIVSRSKRIGSEVFSGRNVTERTEERPLLSEDEARRMSLDEVIVLVDAQHPIRAKRIKYYEDRKFAPIFDAQDNAVLPYPSEEKLAVSELALENETIKSRLSSLENRINGTSSLDNAIEQGANHSKSTKGRQVRVSQTAEQSKFSDEDFNALQIAVANAQQLDERL